MNISMWNLFYNLPFEHIIPMVRNGSPSITCARLIVSTDLDPNAVFVGKSSDFFYEEETTIIVHRHDMILVPDIEPAEVFNEVCKIIDRFARWEAALENCLHEKDGLTQILDISKDFVGNPMFIYAPDGRNLAISSHYGPEINWHWAEILANNGLTEERMQNLKAVSSLTTVFKDLTPTIHTSNIGLSKYIHCSILAKSYMAGHFVLFEMVESFNESSLYICEILVGYFSRFMEMHYSEYSSTSRLGQFFISILSGYDYQKEDMLLLMNSLRWSIEDSFQLYLIKESVANEPVLLTKLYTRLLEECPNSIVFIINGNIAIINNLTRESQVDSLLNTLPDLLQDEYCIGISQAFDGISRCSLYYRQALYELSQCEQQHVIVAKAENNRLNYFYKALHAAPLTNAYIPRSLHQLKEYDARNHTFLYETLRAYCLASFHLSDTAKYLGIHRNSVSYRLERIQEIIDFAPFYALMDAPDTNRMMELYLAFFYLDHKE
ncbi:MAG: helix-turn-helix domain-containing protein [Lachnospiraceae bacterium]|nr:helix-turn-helix domain-containing protein [Lachnospiraceae bacterium]